MRYSQKTIFNMAAVRHFELAKCWYFVMWSFVERESASAYQISLKTDDSWLRYSDKIIFKMAAVRHLECSKFGIVVKWPLSNVILLLRTKFRVNRTINCWDIPKTLFSILDLQNFDILRRGCYWNQNLHLHKKFRWNRIIFGWDRAKKKTFSKWRPSAVLNFRNLVFWSCDLCLTWSCFFMPNFALIGQ